ncbi:MAG: metalloregulator ArsR/SmtB family transcription factor [Pseudomonadales bacterium]
MTKQTMDLARLQENAVKVSELMKLLGHPQRLLILCELAQGECSVSELSDRLDINQSPLSQHLARMRYEGVVTSRRQAQTVFYALADGKVAAVLELLYSLYCKPAASSRRTARG